jgi:hypothetical protein
VSTLQSPPSPSVTHYHPSVQLSVTSAWRHILGPQQKYNSTYILHLADVSADSWGTDYAMYDTSAATVDAFLWEHQDFVSVFAAGNFGRAGQYRSTVTSPATSKSSISVGATMKTGTPGAAQSQVKRD